MAIVSRAEAKDVLTDIASRHCPRRGLSDQDRLMWMEMTNLHPGLQDQAHADARARTWQQLRPYQRILRRSY